MPLMTRRLFGLGVLAGAAIATSISAARADWPERQIDLIVPYAAGGATDTLGRKIADALGTLTGQAVVVRNFAGAGGVLGTTMAANAAPDGYTLFLGQISSHGIAPALYQSLNYDPIKSFTPIVRVYSIPNVLVVPKNFPADTFADFMKVAKERKLRFASSGVGTSIHLSGELFKAATGVDMVHVPFRGSGEAMPALVSGNVDLMFDNAPSAIPQIKSGALKVLAVTTAKRSPELPDVPTLQEVGGPALAAFAVEAWFGIFAPAGLDPALVKQINAKMNQVLESKDFLEFAKSQAATIDGGTPEELAKHVEAELAKWSKVIDTAGIEKK